MDYEEKQNPEEAESKYHGSFAALYRIHNILTDCNFYSNNISDGHQIRPELLQKWKNSLKTLYREVDCKLNDNEREEVDKVIKQYSKYNPLVVSKSIKNGETISKYVYKNINGYYQVCDLLEKTLRRFANNKGLILQDKKIDRITGREISIME